MPGQQEPDPETERRVHKVEKDVTAAVDETSSIEDIGDADGEGDIVRLIRKASTACAVRQLAQCSCMQVPRAAYAAWWAVHSVLQARRRGACAAPSAVLCCYDCRSKLPEQAEPASPSCMLQCIKLPCLQDVLHG